MKAGWKNRHSNLYYTTALRFWHFTIPFHNLYEVIITIIFNVYNSGCPTGNYIIAEMEYFRFGFKKFRIAVLLLCYEMKFRNKFPAGDMEYVG